MTKVVIGIQARSTSTRFPGKINELIGDKTMLQHVMSSCFSAALYINNWSSKGVLVSVCLLVPYSDPITARVDKEIEVIEGPEEDVLTRYSMLNKKFAPDYIVRITADCPLIPSFVISKLITLAVMNKYDYVSNVEERFRTAPDGVDCEVISSKAMDWLGTNATAYEREHVTAAFRVCPPSWANIGTVINFFDYSGIKMSVDTKDDLNAVREEYNRISVKYAAASSRFGKRKVHRY